MDRLALSSLLLGLSGCFLFKTSHLLSMGRSFLLLAQVVHSFLFDGTLSFQFRHSAFFFLHASIVLFLFLHASHVFFLCCTEPSLFFIGALATHFFLSSHLLLIRLLLHLAAFSLLGNSVLCIVATSGWFLPWVCMLSSVIQLNFVTSLRLLSLVGVRTKVVYEGAIRRVVMIIFPFPVVLND